MLCQIEESNAAQSECAVNSGSRVALTPSRNRVNNLFGWDSEKDYPLHKGSALKHAYYIFG